MFVFVLVLIRFRFLKKETGIVLVTLSYLVCFYDSNIFEIVKISRVLLELLYVGLSRN